MTTWGRGIIGISSTADVSNYMFKTQASIRNTYITWKYVLEEQILWSIHSRANTYVSYIEPASDVHVFLF